jgi:hypothetical protein
MKHEGVNSTRLAEILGIQASGISHIMSGRNKPSYDFLQKLLQRFPQINPDWLLLDKGPMYRDEIKNKSGQNASASTGQGTSAIGGQNVLAGSNSGGVVGSGGSHLTTSTAEAMERMGGRGGENGLFGPDNNDLIPSGGQFAGGVTHANGQFAGSGAGADAHGYSAGGRDQSGPASEGGHSAGFGDRTTVGQMPYEGQMLDFQQQTSLQNPPQSSPQTSPQRSMQDMSQRASSQNLQQAFAQNSSQHNSPQRVSSQSASRTSSQQNPSQVLPHSNSAEGRADQRVLQNAVYQSGGFARSAFIERIVVFYKDKTFSEYQPE